MKTTLHRLTCLLLFALCGMARAAPAGTPEIEPELMAKLASGERIEYAVHFPRPDLSAAFGMSWEERGRHVYDTLRAAAETSQAPLRRHLAKSGYRFQGFWIDNLVLVRDGDAKLLRKLGQGAFPGALRVATIPEAQLAPLDMSPVMAQPKSANPQPNLVRIKAPQAWALGGTGAGTVIGIIDAPVLPTHEALRERYRGYQGGGVYDHHYNYLSPLNLGGISPPGADNHGTMVAGAAVGVTATDTYGIAPQAQWIACSDCCSGPAILMCGQFMAAPTDLNFQSPDPDLRPHVVNNSWGSGCSPADSPFYQSIVASWIAAGIVPVFSNGNIWGPGNSGHPGCLGEVLAVGSTGRDDGQIAAHSSWGPSPRSSPGLPFAPDHRGFPYLKPNVMAPGVGILTALAAGDTAYGLSGGSSISAPHVAGAIAAMISAAPCLTGDYPTLGTLLMGTTTPIPYDSGEVPPPPFDNTPNYATGWGEIDVEAAVRAAKAHCNVSATLAGTITDAATGAPIADARVRFHHPAAPGEVFETRSDAAGQYAMALIPAQSADVATLTISAYGYATHLVVGLLVDPGANLTRNAALAPQPQHAVSGRVRDALTGRPLHARIEAGSEFGSYGAAPAYSHVASGTYALPLSGDSSGLHDDYRLTASAMDPGYARATHTLANLAGDTARDFLLQPDLVDCTTPGYSDASGSCAPLPGVFVSGRVIDLVTGLPVSGAQVSINEVPATTSAASSDPLFGAGFYRLFVDVGTNTLRAHAPGYQPLPQPLFLAADVGANDQFHFDLNLLAARLELDPAAGLALELMWGASETATLNASNQGYVAANAHLVAGEFRQDFETAFPPAGWSVEFGPDAPAGCDWRRNDAWNLPNHATGFGHAAVAHSWCGGEKTMDTWLLSPVLDFSHSPAVALDFVLSYRHGTNGSLWLETSSDGGASWTLRQEWSENLAPDGPGAALSLDLSAALAGAAQARLRFRARGGFETRASLDALALRSEVPWLSVSAGDTTIPASATVTLPALHFNAGAVPGPGTYSTHVSLHHDTPYAVQAIPVTLTVVPAPEADLGLSLTPSATQVEPGDLFSVTLRLNNAGPATAPGAQVLANLPGNASLIDVSTDAFSCSTSPLHVGCDLLAPLPPDIERSVTLTLLAGTKGQIPLSAQATLQGSAVDPDMANNTDSVTVTVGPPPGIEVFTDGFESGMP